MTRKFFISVLFLFSVGNVFGDTTVSLDVYSYYLDTEIVASDVLLRFGADESIELYFSPRESAKVDLYHPGWFRADGKPMAICKNGSRLTLLTILDPAVIVNDDSYEEIPLTYNKSEKSDSRVIVSDISQSAPESGEIVWGDYHDAKQVYSRVLELTKVHMHGMDVFCLQRFLMLEGFDEVGTVDGWFGPLTELAVKHFQHRHRLRESGIVDPNTWAVIDEDLSRRLGD